MKLYSLLLFCLVTVGCDAQIPCKDDISLQTIKVVNNGFKWNCGIETLVIEGSGIDSVCIYLQDLKVSTPINTQVNNWLLDIYFNNEKESLFRKNLILCYTVSGHFVFKKNNVFYKNNDFAQFLISKLKITNHNSDPCLKN